MMFVLGFFVGIGAASLIALIVLAAMSCSPDGDEEELPALAAAKAREAAALQVAA
jgi:hypothetical protein